MIVAVTAGRTPLGPAPRDHRPMTRLAAQHRAMTFRAPVSRPGDDARLERWAAESAARAADGGALWTYERQDDGGSTPWTVTYRPTRQTRDWYPTLGAARRDTAGTLLAELRTEAFRAAYTGELAGRAEGQRWIAGHARVEGATEADHRCECGGIIFVASRDGKLLAHLDACSNCWTHGEGYTLAEGETCPTPEAHLFCGTPAPAACGHHGDDRRYAQCAEPALPNRGDGCGRGLTVDCCGTCCDEDGGRG